MIIAQCAAMTDVGRVRGNNEDNYFVNGVSRSDVSLPRESCFDDKKRKSYIFAVCDGMGGEENGETASKIAAEAIGEFFGKNFDNIADKYFDYANRLILKEMKKSGASRMGSTVALLYIDEESAYCYNIGDSRIYLYRDGVLAQLTKDHTQAQSMVDMGLLRREDMNSSKGKHVLTQHLGIFPDELVIQPEETGAIGIAEEDFFILCSDGITDMLDESDISEIVGECADARTCAEKILNLALERGGKDNATVIAVKIKDVEKGYFWNKIF